MMAASGKASSGGLAPTGKVVAKPGQARPTIVTPQSSGKIQTKLTSTTSRLGNGAAPPPVRKSSLVSTSSTASSSSSQQQRGLKLRPTNPSVLPVLCVYSDQNQLVRKEQFRVPPASQVKPQPRNNNENLQAPRSSVPNYSSSGSQIPVATQARAIHLKSTISSTARVGNNNSNTGAKRSKMTVPRSTATKVPQPVALPSNNNKGNSRFQSQLPLDGLNNPEGNVTEVDERISGKENFNPLGGNHDNKPRSNILLECVV